MEFEVRGWSGSGPTLDLDHERFAYAGKFVMSGTGKAAVCDGGDLIGAAAFSPDRTDESVLVVRYITVRRDCQGEGVGPRLLRYVADCADDRGFGTVRIAVNNPFAYEAAYRAGFVYEGDETGLAELVLVDSDGGVPSAETYRAGLAVFADRDLPPAAEAFVDRHRDSDPPTPVASPA